MSDLWLPALVAFLLSLVMTGLMRRYALARQLMDVPNARSSHTTPTPRGGGLAIVIGFGVALGVALVRGDLDGRLLVAVLPAVFTVAAVGFWDDHRDVPARVRIVIHFAAMVWAVAWLGGALALPVPWGGSAAGWPVTALAVIGMVWFLNLFNFMDGIDGIAASEAVFIALGLTLLATFSGLAHVALGGVLLGASALGFLLWNWPPARIFMGDVGSGFLGSALALLGYAAGLADAGLFWAWLVLGAVFVSDATVTLGRRVVRGERWYAAHRSHAYQWAARRWGHRAVTLGVTLINAAWLAPLAYVAYRHPALGGPVAALAYLPLIVLALVIGAGRKENA